MSDIFRVMQVTGREIELYIIHIRRHSKLACG